MAAESALDTTTSVVGRAGRGRRVEIPSCAASDGAAAVEVAVNNLQNRVDRDSRNIGVDDDILDSRRCYCQTIRIHARRLPVGNWDAVPIQRCRGSIVAAAAADVGVVADNHPGHTAAEVPSSDLMEVVRDSLVAVVARSKVGSNRS
jgi:hypothetical protein